MAGLQPAIGVFPRSRCENLLTLLHHESHEFLVDYSWTIPARMHRGRRRRTHTTPSSTAARTSHVISPRVTHEHAQHPTSQPARRCTASTAPITVTHLSTNVLS